MVDRRDRPCRDPLKRDSGRYAITLMIRTLPVGGIPVRRPLTGPTCNKQRQPPRVRAPRKPARRRRAWTSTLAPPDAPSKRARARALVIPDPRLASVARKVEAWV